MTLDLGKEIPNFSFISTGGDHQLKDFRGKQLVLYFYPKDNTPGCTCEGQNFRDEYSKFLDLNTLIFGVSRDSLKSHTKFKETQNFPFELICDENENLCQLFEVIKEKNMYGKKVLGIERSTFLVDAQGKLVHEWRKVKVDGHVKDILERIKQL